MPESGTWKFVLVQSPDGDYHFLAGPGEMHQDVFESSRYEDSFDGKVKGGGRISITENVIEAYGHSIGYGMADQGIVKSLLEEYVLENCPKKRLLVQMGRGY